MSSSQDFVASQVFFYLRRDINQSVFAFDSGEGLTVPFFSSLDLAQKFLETTRVRGHSVDLITPTRMMNFHESCKLAGAKFLQLDPLPEVLKTSKVQSITFK
ncbi:MAG: hypothetical protein JNN15_05035 [Blastocatellia bacterium]|nr:hypothetical protein [Blastocatellia bacterium]